MFVKIVFSVWENNLLKALTHCGCAGPLSLLRTSSWAVAGRGCSLAAVLGLLTVMASLAAERGSSCAGVSRRRMCYVAVWHVNLPQIWIKGVSPASAGRLLSTVPPENPSLLKISSRNKCSTFSLLMKYKPRFVCYDSCSPNIELIV